jgi:two-component system response regulator DegU
MLHERQEPVDVGSPAPSRVLSVRELEVLELLSHGLTNVEIASRLSITTHAVKFHLSSIYRKLGVANRTEATAVFLRPGWTAIAAPA